ncbi:Hpt domain-containing protein [Polaribacter sp. KT25b]|uniref:Hpt domain-containing protein n=1 Tax=Polaribacter sp. KT25b TaxID=1855336 RepID=UPI00087B1098|nr:Hpt domain-containing protein [Polaribacter sp. KT25b]SDS47567.1 Hpt domain-containing protein [Polaribacter sp. KT25b]
MEQPNLVFIKEIVGDDAAFQESLLEIIKKEFPEEVKLFIKNFSQKKYEEASNNVHKLKHKISLLGLKEGFDMATDFENELKEGKTTLHSSFLEILNKIGLYLHL